MGTAALTRAGEVERGAAGSGAREGNRSPEKRVRAAKERPQGWPSRLAGVSAALNLHTCKAASGSNSIFGYLYPTYTASVSAAQLLVS